MTRLQCIPSCVVNDPAYGQLKQYIIDTTGLAYYSNKDVEFAAQITRRLTATRFDGCQSYLDYLLDGHSGELELGTLTASLTIGETFFFRHHELFDSLRERVIPEIIHRNQSHRRLRIWSAGCAIGAEPYSLAILLRRDFETQLADWEVSIVGTDINRDFLAQAQRGEFGDWTLRSMPDDLKASCFTRSGPNWILQKEYRRGVEFQYHNLVQHPFPSLVNSLSAFDLILCRNVMIYFDPTSVRQLVRQFHDSLVDGGWFAVGPAELNVNLFRAFETVNLPEVVLYRKNSQHALPTWSPPDVPDVVASSHFNGKTQPEDITVFSGRTSEAVFTSQHRSVGARLSSDRPPVFPQRATLADIRAQLNGGQSDAAAELCQRLINADRLNPLVHFYHALAAEQQGRHTESEQALRRAIYLNRDFVLAHYHLGLLFHRSRDASAAQRSFRNVLALLRRREEAERFADADGLTVGALRELTEMHLEVLNRI